MATEENPSVPDPQGTLGRLPYDLRPPTKSRFVARVWNRDDPRMFPPKSFGWGYTINFYWLFHLATYFRAKHAASAGSQG
jgi:hypothetical protein